MHFTVTYSKPLMERILVHSIFPIVEGYGDETAVPCLVKRWLRFRNYNRYFNVHNPAINAKGCGRLKAPYNRLRHIGIEHYVEAALRNNADAILVVLDADKECFNRKRNGLGPELLARARAVAEHIPLAVVVANPEYEAWFLASLTSIRAKGLLPQGNRLPDPLHPEVSSGCKGKIASLLGASYEESTHQSYLTNGLSFSAGTRRRSPSYGKLIRDLERLTRKARQN